MGACLSVEGEFVLDACDRLGFGDRMSDRRVSHHGYRRSKQSVADHPQFNSRNLPAKLFGKQSVWHNEDLWLLQAALMNSVQVRSAVRSDIDCITIGPHVCMTKREKETCTVLPGIFCLIRSGQKSIRYSRG